MFVCVENYDYEDGVCNKSGPHCRGREDSAQFAQQFVVAVTASPLVCCVVWSLGRQHGVCSVYVWWLLNVRESSIGVCSELCPVCFPIVRECVSVLL